MLKRSVLPSDVAEAVAFLATLESYQHPDRDTDQWPMENRHG